MLAVLSPLIHLVAAIIDLIVDRKHWRTTRFVGIGLAFCVVEVFGLFTLLTVWIGSGFGLFMKRPFWVRANTVLTGQYLEMITRAVRFYLGFSFSCTVDKIPDGPLLLFSRHAGPCDSFLIVRVVIRELGRVPHAIGAAKLQWDPFLDIVGERLGFHYLSQNPADAMAEIDKIKALATKVGHGETLVLFPEGGNYTPGRRIRSIDRMRERGHHDHAERAERLQHTLLPRVGGAIAAIEGSPDATVLFIAHAGLEGIHGFSDLWSSVPLRRKVVAHGWPCSIEGLSSELTERTRWLFDEWVVVDDWIDETLRLHTADLPTQAEQAPDDVIAGTAPGST